MILALDIGNTSITLGCIKNGNILFAEHLSTDYEKTSLEYTISFKIILEIHGLTPLDIKGGTTEPMITP